MTSGKRVIGVLSIDGGGIRGIIPARVLVELERLAGRPVASMFDVVAGTSTGGVLAMGLTRPGPDGEAGMTAEKALQLYTHFGDVIFPRPVLRASRTSIAALRSWTTQRLRPLVSAERYGNARYRAEALEDVLKQFLEPGRLGDSLSNVVVPAYDWRAGRAVVFRSREAREGARSNPAMWQVARATTAAPTYFPPFRLMLDQHEGVLIDGGIAANNPTSIAFFEALCLEALDGEPADLVVVSLGTGRPPEEIPTYEELWSRGWLKLGMGMLGVMFDGTSEVIDDLIATVIAHRPNQSRYWRFQTDLRGVSLDFDDASERNVAGLVRLADQLIADRHEDLAELAQLLSRGGAEGAGQAAVGARAEAVRPAEQPPTILQPPH